MATSVTDYCNNVTTRPFGRYLSENFPKFSESLFNEFGWRDRLSNSNFTEKKLPLRRFFCEYIRSFSAFSERSKVSFAFGTLHKKLVFH